MEITIVAKSRHQYAWAEALWYGVQACGGRAYLQPQGTPRTKQVACWGWRNGSKLRSQGFDVLVMERGYLGDRFHWTSLGWNGLNGYATFPWVRDDPTRFNLHYQMAPWKDGGEYVLLVGQVPGDMSLRGRDMRPWYQTMVEVSRALYGLPVRFRPHPRSPDKTGPKGAELIDPVNRSVVQDLEQAAVCVTYNSNTAVEAVLAGVPTVTMDRGSMAWDVTAHEVGEIVKPDRERWAARLAWCQWSMHEIRRGRMFEAQEIAA